MTAPRDYRPWSNPELKLYRAQLYLLMQSPESSNPIDAYARPESLAAREAIRILDACKDLIALTRPLDARRLVGSSGKLRVHGFKEQAELWPEMKKGHTKAV